MALKDSVLNVVIRAKDATGAGFKKLRGSIKDTDTQTGKLGKSIRRAVVAIGSLAATYLSLRAITGFFTGAVRESADFEEALAKVQAVSQASAEDMDRLKKAATEMGAATTFNASQAANAMETLSRAGLNVDETLQALPEVLALARGNSIELAEAAGLVTQSIQGMGGTFEESGRYADVLTRAAQLANTSVTGLGQALSYAAPTARALGLDVEQTAALVGKLADAGIDASRAGTALNSIFSQFQNPASKFRGELDALGITTNDFGDALAQLEASGNQGQAAINAVGQEAGPALRALLAQGVGSLKELEEELRNAGGSAQQAADTMDDTLPGALERLASAWRTLKRAIGDNVLGPAKGAIDELATGVRDFVNSGGVEKLGAQFREMFEEITRKTREFLKAFDFKGAMDKAGDALVTFGKIASNTGKALELTGTVISTVWNGVAFVVGGALAVISKAIAGFGLTANLMVQGLNKVGLVADETARSFDMHANALNHMADELANYSVGSLKKVGQNLGVVAKETGKAAKETDELVDALAMTNEEMDGYNAAMVERINALNGTTEATKDAADATETQAEKVERLQAVYDELKASGTASMQELGQALVELNRAQGTAVESSAALEAAYRTLGTTSQAELLKAAETAKKSFEVIQASGTASAEDVERAFAAYAKTVQETGDEALISAVETEAAVLGLTTQLGEAGKAGSKAGDDIKGGLDKAAIAAKELKAEQDAAADAAEQRSNKVAAWGAAFAKALTNARESVTALSTAARNMFEEKIGSNQFVEESLSASEALEKTQQRVDELARARQRLMSNSFAAWFADTALAAAEVRKEFYAQAVAMERLQEQVESGTLSMGQLNRMSETAVNQFDLLDDQRLNGLQGAIDSARHKLESLNASAEDTLTNLRKRLADIRGDTEESQRIQYDTERKRLQELLAEAEQAGATDAAADYQKSLGTLENIYQLEQKKNREAQQEREKQEQARQAQQVEADRARQEAEQTRSQTTNQPGTTQAVKTVNVNIGGQRVRVLEGDEAALIRALENARGTAA